MATTLKQTEAIPATYPTGDSDAAWQRIEAYVAHRWTERAVSWIVEGCGEWCAPLTPATITTVEVWTGSAWETATPDASPLGGYVLTGTGPYRFAGTVGAGPVPAAVIEAARRLTAYLAELADPTIPAGWSSYSDEVGDVRTSIDRAPAWIARAIQNSGAADLLRPYRRA